MTEVASGDCRWWAARLAEKNREARVLLPYHRDTTLFLAELSPFSCWRNVFFVRPVCAGGI